MLFPLYMLAALTPPRQSEPDLTPALTPPRQSEPDLTPALTPPRQSEPDLTPALPPDPAFTIDAETTGYSVTTMGRPVIRFAPLPPPTPLDRSCPVCDAEPGNPCDPARLGKAGRKGRTVHRGR